MKLADDQYQLFVCAPLKGWLFGRAGLTLEMSVRLFSCSTVGSAQFPAAEPSVRPQAPLARVLAEVSAVVQAVAPKQLAFFSQIRPVRLSLTVPSPLSLKRGTGQTTPFWIAPSSPPA